MIVVFHRLAKHTAMDVYESTISIIIIHLFEKFFYRIQVFFHSLRVVEQVLKVIFVLQSIKLGLKLRFKQRF